MIVSNINETIIPIACRITSFLLVVNLIVTNSMIIIKIRNNIAVVFILNGHLPLLFKIVVILLVKLDKK
jgi:hypothetical protein